MELLGRKESLKLLIDDIKDLQTALNEIMPSFGKFSGFDNPQENSFEKIDFIKSWKYPGKEAYKIDTESLISKYSPTSKLENDQFSHVALFELLIDR